MNKIKFFTAGSINELEASVNKFSKAKNVVDCNISVSEVYGVIKYYCCLVYNENKEV